MQHPTEAQPSNGILESPSKHSNVFSSTGFPFHQLIVEYQTTLVSNALPRILTPYRIGSNNS